MRVPNRDRHTSMESAVPSWRTIGGRRARPPFHPVAEQSRWLEHRHCAGRNSNRFAGLGVAGGAGLTVSHLECHESPVSMPSPRTIASFAESRNVSTTNPQFFLVTLGPTKSAAYSTRSALVMPLSTLGVQPSLVVVCQELAFANSLFVGFASTSARYQASPIVVRRATT